MSSSSAVYRLPVHAVLQTLGIPFKTVTKQGTTWHNFMTCPLCEKTDKGQACGISETVTFVDGETQYIHGVKCFHGGGASGLGESPKYGDLLRHLGALDRSWDAVATWPAIPASRTVGKNGRGSPVSLEWIVRMESALWRTPAALGYLRKRGLSDETIRRFRIGLRGEVKDSPSKNAISFPTLAADLSLTKPYACYAVPGLTVGTDSTAWAPGAPTTYYADAISERRTTVIVCEGMKDVWRVWQAIQGMPLANEVLLITSTHGTSAPSEWQTPTFWIRFEKVYLGFDRDEAGERFAQKVAAWVADSGRTALRLIPPPGILTGSNAAKPGKDWTDYFNGTGTVSGFITLMDSARPVQEEQIQDAAPGVQTAQMGRLSYRPIDITSSCVDGALYYATKTLVRTMGRVPSADPDGEPEQVVQEKSETVVIRSDRTVHRAVRVPAPRGTPDSERVWRLQPAGVLIDAPPTPNRYASWDWDAIQRWQKGEYRVRNLRELLAEIEHHLRQSFWLPNDDDYVLLSLVIPVTYVMPVFDAVPLIFVNGPRGTGKTTIGRTMAQLAYNASVIGAVSAAAVARHIDESRGFVALDDLESIGTSRRNGGDGQFGDLVQALKLSYNKDTATKLWVDTKTMQTRELHFFGVKIISNTSGVDGILGSRMFRIHTRVIPAGLRGQVNLMRAADLAQLRQLRDELHAWSFDHVSAIARHYAEAYPRRTDRADEIAAPLRVMAALAGDVDIAARLERALDRQRNVTTDHDDPLEVLEDAVKALVLEGYREVSPQHVSLEMGRIFGPSWGKESTTDIPEWQRPDWVGRQLRARDLVELGAEGRRPRLEWGYQLRVYPVRQGFIESVAAEAPAIEPRDVRDFCRGCASCPYAATGCDLQKMRVRWEDARRPMSERN